MSLLASRCSWCTDGTCDDCRPDKILKKLSVQEAAKKYDVKEERIMDLVGKNAIPFVVENRNVVFLESWLDDHHEAMAEKLFG